MIAPEKDASPDMKSNFPKTVTLMEVGPRDGLQSEKKIVPTPLKVDIISGLVSAGIRLIQVGAFVSPGRVPQMADTDNLPALLTPTAGVIYNYLVLSRNGFERAMSSGAQSVEISASASDTHSRKNTGMPGDKAMGEAVKMIERAKDGGLHVRASIQCAFGCVYEGDIDPEFVRSTAMTFLSQNPDMLVLADTTGMAVPDTVKAMLERILPETGKIPVALHLHDTRGFGLANVAAAMECNVTHFDTAISGMGGCPFVPGAAGNISTEKTARMMADMNIQTGIDIEGVTRCSRRLRAYLFDKGG
jgi:hydroxymethylglutaryl-CoA lyase